MKDRKIILSIMSVLTGMAFLIGSTGITVIIHSCHHCGDFSVHSGMFVSPEMPEDHCCEAAISHCTADDTQSFVGDCCHFKIDKLKLVNYTPSEKITHESPVATPYRYIIHQFSAVHGSEINSLPFHNKHGGRYLLINTCQFLS